MPLFGLLRDSFHILINQCSIPYQPELYVDYDIKGSSWQISGRGGGRVSIDKESRPDISKCKRMPNFCLIIAVIKRSGSPEYGALIEPLACRKFYHPARADGLHQPFQRADRVSNHWKSSAKPSPAFSSDILQNLLQ